MVRLNRGRDCWYNNSTRINYNNSKALIALAFSHTICSRPFNKSVTNYANIFKIQLTHTHIGTTKCVA